MTVLGDPVPERLAAYYAALDDGRLDDAVESFSVDVLYAVPRRGAHEVDPRNQVTGRQALRELFEERGVVPHAHRLLVCVSDGSSCMVEGVVQDRESSAPTATFTASLQLDDDGVITRYLAYQCAPAVLPGPTAAAGGVAWADANNVVDGYFKELEAGRFEAAAQYFSDDVLYSHPPYRHTGIETNLRIDFHGRGELLAGFSARGKASFEHRVGPLLQSGPHALFETVVEKLPGGGTGGSVSSLTLDRDGRIARYVAFYCEPSVTRR